ncbi:fungal specific transcription factor domain-containing protein [Aspergillus affinis]|uniref:fungal specific transcription factor domain-containing protein n=1 Tax=Aspergillus affinis TaxID=1070780 RepID=UPI0022FEFF76|nr:PAF acetylhydrolase [Aspergillus affinis]KAI9035967.1 PAF acetylhydrolase [Aspergillus affinis]
MPDETPPEDQYGHFHGFATGFAFLQFAKQRLASLPSMPLDFSDYPLTNAGNLPSILPPKSVADDLIRDYFDFGLTTSRFVHKPSLLAVYEKIYNLEETFNPNQDDLALVYMVMATGSHYSKQNSVFFIHSDSWSRKVTIFTGRLHFDVVKELVEGIIQRGKDAWFMTSVGTSHPSVTDAPLIEPLLLSWTTGATIDVKEGVQQYVQTSLEFLKFLQDNHKRGILQEPVSHPEYDQNIRDEKRRKEQYPDVERY